MLQPPVKIELKSELLEVNAHLVQAILAAAPLHPQSTVMFTLYRGELVTYAQAIDMREND